MTIEFAEKYIGSKVKSVLQVHGGNTSNAYKVETSSSTYFIKERNLGDCPDLFEKESLGLNALKTSSTLIVPAVLNKGIHGSKQFIMLEWLDKKKPSERSWAELGSSLATMHQPAQPYFGFTTNNYIGSLFQDNTQFPSWHLFYGQCRIMPFVKTLKDSGLLTGGNVTAAEHLCSQLENIFPAETPSLLHGDLWNGNFMFTARGPAIFDPAVYYGHREMDIGMTLLFGGFDEEFYESYNHTYPLSPGWKQRVPYTQLYPLLAHAVFFGDHYVSKVKEILSIFQ
jgi:fructosamine-3-kinase